MWVFGYVDCVWRGWVGTSPQRAVETISFSLYSFSSSLSNSVSGLLHDKHSARALKDPPARESHKTKKEGEQIFFFVADHKSPTCHHNSTCVSENVLLNILIVAGAEDQAGRMYPPGSHLAQADRSFRSSS